MSTVESGLRTIQGINVVPLDGLWETVATKPAEEKMKTAIAYAGASFYDSEQRFVAARAVSLVGLGGQPIARSHESDAQITQRITDFVTGSEAMMATSASFSYLNSGEKEQAVLFDAVIKLGHFSIAHTVSLNILVAGISQAAELELSLQRDLVHISKVTNVRTTIQVRPPIVVAEERYLELAQSIDAHTAQLIELARSQHNANEQEIVNGFNPVNKATILMLSGDLSNFKKIGKMRDDKGKEKELRDIADDIHTQLNTAWPQIFNEKKEN